MKVLTCTAVILASALLGMFFVTGVKKYKLGFFYLIYRNFK